MSPNVLVPATPGLGEAVGVLLAVTLTIGWLHWLTRRLSRVLDASGARVLQLSSSLVLLGTLTAGWMIVSHPALWWALAPDAGTYQQLIEPMREALPAVVPPARLADRSLFLFLVAVTQRLFGGHAYVSVVLNAGLSATSMLLLARLTVRLDPSRLSRPGDPYPTPTYQVTAAIYASIPVVYLWMASPLREAMAITLMVVSLCAAVAYAQGSSTLSFMVGVGAAAALGGVRPAHVPVALGTLLLALLLRAWPSIARRTPPRSTLAVATSLLAALAVLAAPRASRASFGFLVTAQERFEHLSLGATTAIPPLPPGTPWLETLTHLPRMTARYLWGPFPGTLLAQRPLLLLEVIVWWVLTPMLVLGVLSIASQAPSAGTSGSRVVTRRDHFAAALPLVAAGGTTLIGALTLGNYGIVSRLRVGTWVLLLPYAAIGIVATLERLRHTRRRPGSMRAEATGSEGDDAASAGLWNPSEGHS